MKPFGKSYKDVQEATPVGFRKLPAGGYVCRIVTVEDTPAKEYLRVVYDIAEGEYAGFYSDDWGKDHPYAHQVYWSYKEKNRKYFKANMGAVDKSNGTEFNKALEGNKEFNERALIGLQLGLLIGYEEYQTDRGDIRQRTTVAGARSVQTIRSGEFEVPPLKRLDGEKEPQAPVDGFIPVNDSDLPF